MNTDTPTLPMADGHHRQAGAALVDALDDALPQTQCTRCGYADCRAYAEAMADGSADINHCPPGGHEGIERLAALTQRAEKTLDPTKGREGPRHLAVIDEAECIGCTLCLQACPVDCIVGGPKAMHTVIDDLCTGCELCIPACPVDCIALVPASGSATGWQAWSRDRAIASRQRYAFHKLRLERDAREQAERMTRAAPDAHAAPTPDSEAPGSDLSNDHRASVVQAALARAREARQRR